MDKGMRDMPSLPAVPPIIFIFLPSSVCSASSMVLHCAAAVRRCLGLLCTCLSLAHIPSFTYTLTLAHTITWGNPKK